MAFTTANLCDQFSNEVQVAEPLLHDFGGVDRFRGSIVTLSVFEDDALVRETLQEAGEGRVLVVDGGGSKGHALLDSELATIARQNGWSGVIVHGAIRETSEVVRVPVGVKALASTPLGGRGHGRGTKGRPVHFGGITFRTGDYLYADRDGIITAARDLLNNQS